MLGYLAKLKLRMVQRGFLSGDPLLDAVVQAENAVHALHVQVHYLSCGDVVGRQRKRAVIRRLAADIVSLPRAFCHTGSSARIGLLAQLSMMEWIIDVGAALAIFYVAVGALTLRDRIAPPEYYRPRPPQSKPKWLYPIWIVLAVFGVTIWLLVYWPVLIWRAIKAHANRP